MKKFSLIILLLVLCLFISGYSYAESSVNSLIGKATLSTTSMSLEIVADYSEFVWIVPPMLEHNFIYHCVVCDSFTPTFDCYSGRRIDRKTGEFMDEDVPRGGHGGSGDLVFYDSEKNLIGIRNVHGPTQMFPFDGFIENTNDFVVAGWVNSPVWVEKWDESGWWYEDPDKYAVMYNGRFITDFLFDEFNYEGVAGRSRNAIIAMGMEGSWGLIDRNGNVALPFVFEHIVVIDNDTAFAKYNGRYGILDLRSSIVRSPQIQINGEIVRIPFGDQQSIIVDGRTLVPLRAVMEALGFEVGWETTSQNRVTLIKLEFDISFTIGSRIMIVNGNNVSLDVPAQLINGRTMVPLRAISEATGMEVRWDDENLIVDILTDLY